MKMLIAILPLFLLAATPCTKCSLNKSQMKCEFYVAKKGDLSKIDECKLYADYLFDTKVYGKAAWYYLLAKEPKRAIEAGKEALKMGEDYANEYIGAAYLIMNDKQKAKKYLQKFQQNIGDSRFFTSNDFAILGRIYNNFNENEAKKLMQK